jgi:cobalamin-dependent methionine synthase I
MQSLLTPEQKDQYILDIEKDYARARDQHANKKGVNILKIIHHSQTYSIKLFHFKKQKALQNGESQASNNMQRI